MRINLMVFALGLISTALFAGCTSAPRMSGDIKTAVADERARGVDAARATADVLKPRRMAVEYVATPFIATRSGPPEDVMALPPVFAQRFTLRLRSEMSLNEFAARVTELSGLRVIIGADTGKASGTAQAGAEASGTIKGEFADLSLESILDSATAKVQMTWDYAPTDNAIVIKRVITRHFVMRVLPGDASITASSNLGGATSSGSASGQAGQQTVSSTAAYKPRDEFEKQIKQLLSPAGSLVISDVTNTITVTDTRHNLRAVERLIEAENRVASRQVVVRMQLISLTTTEQRDLGLDLQTAFERIGAAGEVIGGAIGSPASLASSLTGIFKFNWTQESGRGTQSAGAVINALAQLGNVRVVQDRAVTTFHNRAVPFSATEQNNYLARITPAPSGGSGIGSGVPGLEPGTVTTGFAMVVRPMVLDDNRVMVSLNVSNSRLVRMDQATAGTGANALSIQTPKISANQFEQQVGLQSGQTILINAYDVERDGGDRRGLTPGDSVGVGGSFTGTRSREHFFVLLTPMIIDI